MYDTLQDFIRQLEKSGELRRVKAEVDPRLEITEIADRVVKRGGPALLFEKVKGSPFPLVTNLFGTRARMSRALGAADLEEVAGRIGHLLEMKPPEGLWEKMKMLPTLSELAGAAPKSVSRGVCQEVVEEKDPSFEPFPIQTCWPLDAGRFITLPLVVTQDPVKKRRNIGMYRVQIHDERTAGLHWQTQKDAALQYQDALGGPGKRMPVAICLGGDPVLTYAATAPLPPDIDEALFAGFLRRAPVEMVAAKSIDLEVPAASEIVFEGYVTPGELRSEGPFGDHTGFYTPPEDFPVFHLTCVTRRKDPVYPCTIVGKPPMEDQWLGKATERIFLPLVRKMLPEIVDMNLPVEGGFNSLAVVSIRKRYPGHARKVMHALWGLGQMCFTKIIVVVDHDVNVQDLSEVSWKVSMNIDPRRDLEIVQGPVDTLNHASPLRDYGSKAGIDATAKTAGEGYARTWPTEIRMSQEVVDLVTRRWKEYGLD